MIHPGLPICIMVLLATVYTLKNDKGMHKRKKRCCKIGVSYLICVTLLMVCWVCFNDGIETLSSSWSSGSPFPVVDPETHPASLPIMASGGDDGRCSHNGEPGHDHRPSSSRLARLGASSSCVVCRVMRSLGRHHRVMTYSPCNPIGVMAQCGSGRW
jgi:hypothetical protein